MFFQNILTKHHFKTSSNSSVFSQFYLQFFQIFVRFSMIEYDCIIHKFFTRSLFLFDNSSEVFLHFFFGREQVDKEKKVLNFFSLKIFKLLPKGMEELYFNIVFSYQAHLIK